MSTHAVANYTSSSNGIRKPHSSGQALRQTATEQSVSSHEPSEVRFRPSVHPQLQFLQARKANAACSQFLPVSTGAIPAMSVVFLMLRENIASVERAIWNGAQEATRLSIPACGEV